MGQRPIIVDVEGQTDRLVADEQILLPSFLPGRKAAKSKDRGMEAGAFMQKVKR